MKFIKICIVGWYFFEKFYYQLSQSNFDVHIVAHRYNKILDKLNLSYTVIKNEGLEYGAYSHYVDNIWDGKADVFFMHDDIDILNINKFILTNYKKIRKSKAHQGYIVPSKIIIGGGRCMYMSHKFIKCIKKDYGGIWYDKENIGYISRKMQPKDWDARRYNEGSKRFKVMVKNIFKKYKKLISITLRSQGLTLYRRGSTVIKCHFSAKEKKELRKKINNQKNKRKKEVKGQKSNNEKNY